jgi:hypothetical protein
MTTTRFLCFLCFAAAGIQFGFAQPSVVPSACELARRLQSYPSKPGTLTAALFACLVEAPATVGLSLNRAAAANNTTEITDPLLREYTASITELGQLLARGFPEIPQENFVSFEQELRVSGFIEALVGIESLTRVDVFAPTATFTQRVTNADPLTACKAFVAKGPATDATTGPGQLLDNFLACLEELPATASRQMRSEFANAPAFTSLFDGFDRGAADVLATIKSNRPSLTNAEIRNAEQVLAGIRSDASISALLVLQGEQAKKDKDLYRKLLTKIIAKMKDTIVALVS